MNTVLFDLDQTLWHNVHPPDFEHIARLQAARVAPILATAGAEAFVRSFWTEWQRVDAARPPSDPHETEWSVVMAATCAASGTQTSDADARRIWEAINTVPRTAFHTEPVEGSIEMLAALKQRGWRTAIVTNYPLDSALLRPHIDACGIGAGIDVIVTSTDTGLRKPHPQPFLDALAALGTTPAEAAMVGDSFDNDIAPAIALGMMAIHLTADRVPANDASYARIGALAELPPLLGAPTPR
jgi:HAD superfamily hydrolase (TIGR01509 family)